jgi:hypothetical protein
MKESKNLTTNGLPVIYSPSKVSNNINQRFFVKGTVPLKRNVSGKEKEDMQFSLIRLHVISGKNTKFCFSKIRFLLVFSIFFYC